MGNVKKQVYSLDAIRNLMGRLGNVQDELNVIHIAGTNGKGSVGAYISSVLSAQGYRTGTYASPAVFCGREIIKVDGKMIPEEDFTEMMSRINEVCEQMYREGYVHPSSFEAETAAAFCYFKQQGCDFAVIEAGLGGRTDATNLIQHPVCSVFTSISMDHMAFLGDTLEEIAQEKAGIIKQGCPCVSATQKPEVTDVLEHAAARAGSRFYAADGSCIRQFQYDASGSSFFVDWDNGSGEDRDALQVHSAMSGAFQKENFACALEVLRLLQKQGVQISKDAVAKGFCSAYLPGRFEKIMDAPAFYIDGGHNEGAAKQLAKTVRHCFFPRQARGKQPCPAAAPKIVYIIGVLADKEYKKVLAAMLPYARLVFTVTPDNPRALDGQELAREAVRFYANSGVGAGMDTGLGAAEVLYVPDIRQAAARAIKAAGSQGVILAFGSFTFLKQLREAVPVT